MLDFTDPKTKAAPTANVLASPDCRMALPNFGNDRFGGQARAQFAVCDMATHFFAAELAMQTGGNAEAVYKELVANTIEQPHGARRGGGRESSQEHVHRS